MNLLFLKSMFIPKNSFVDINIQSMDKFIKYLKTVNNRFKKIIIRSMGWIGSIDLSERDRFYEFVDQQKKELMGTNISLDIKSWESNYGKCHIFQNIDTEDIDYVLYADHDISPIDDILKDRFIVESLFKNEINNTCNEIGMVSFNQEPDNRHNDTVFINSIRFNERVYYYHTDNMRVATGCFITVPKIISILSKVTLTTVNGVDGVDDVYGEEDMAIGELMNINGFYNIVSSLRVHHPFCTDVQYNEWKEYKLLQCSLIKKFIFAHISYI